MIDYVKLGLLIATFLAGCVVGFYPVHVSYSNYKLEVQATAKAQEEKVKSIRAQQELVTKGISNEYEAKISAIRNYYKSTSVWNNPSSGQMSGLSPAPNATDVITTYNKLASACAETTQQLISLQDWIKAQIGVK